jgi:hypothetical protein
MTPNVSKRTLQFTQSSSETFAGPLTRVRKTETSNFDSHGLSTIKMGDSSSYDCQQITLSTFPGHDEHATELYFKSISTRGGGV